MADELNPRSSFKFSRYRHMGFAALMLVHRVGIDDSVAAVAANRVAFATVARKRGLDVSRL